MTLTLRRIVAIHEILLCVAVIVGLATSGTVAMSRTAIVPALVGVSSAVAGVLLWHGKPFARRLSMLIQALQVPQFALGRVVQYGLGLGVSVVPHIGFAPEAFRSPTHFAFSVGDRVAGLYVGVNILALVALILVARWRPATPAPLQAVVATA